MFCFDREKRDGSGTRRKPALNILQYAEIGSQLSGVRVFPNPRYEEYGQIILSKIRANS